MLSNLILIACLVAGFLFGFFDRHESRGIHSKLLLVTILVLLFFMGAILGFAPDLPQRVIGYGYNAFIITILACLGSAGVTAILIKLFVKNSKEEADKC